MLDTLVGEAVAVAAVIAAATLVRATVGFGDALLAMPLLTLVIGVRAAAPLVTAISLTVAVMVLGHSGGTVAVHDARGLLLGAVPGVPVGVVLLRSLPESLLAGLLGICVVAFGAWRLIRLVIARPDDATLADGDDATGTGGRLAPPAGFAAGALGVATGAGGPPVLVYGVVSGWSPQRFRAILQAFFLCSGILAAVGYAWAGLWTATTLRLYLAALPGVLLALAAGTGLARRVPAQRFAGFVAATTIALGPCCSLARCAEAPAGHRRSPLPAVSSGNRVWLRLSIALSFARRSALAWWSEARLDVEDRRPVHGLEGLHHDLGALDGDNRCGVQSDRVRPVRRAGAEDTLKRCRHVVTRMREQRISPRVVQPGEDDDRVADLEASDRRLHRPVEDERRRRRALVGLPRCRPAVRDR